MRTLSMWLLLSWLVGTARAEPATPISLKSVVTSAGDVEAWKVVADRGTWCSRKAGETLTMTFAKPTALASVEVAHEWTITGATITADGVAHTGVTDKAAAGFEKSQRVTPVTIGGAPVAASPSSV